MEELLEILTDIDEKNTSVFLKTKRLILKVPGPTFAPYSFSYYLGNKDWIGKYSPADPEDFYSIPYQERLLGAERKAYSEKRGSKFWICKNTEPDIPIGTISCFRLRGEGGYRVIEIGYALVPYEREKGYMAEVIERVRDFLVDEWDIDRVEAYVRPDNKASKKVLKKNGFVKKEIIKDFALIDGSKQDHVRYIYKK